jgi:hypothetical protein
MGLDLTLLWQFAYMCVSGMSGLAPHHCLLLVSILSVLHHHQLFVAWRAVTLYYSRQAALSTTLSDAVVVPWYYRIVTCIAVFLLSSMGDLRQRQEFRSKYLLQQVKDEIIDRLEREKEDTVMEQAAQAAMLAEAAAPGASPRLSQRGGKK